MYLNKIMVLGNLARDPELRVLPSGVSVCNMTVATNIVYKKKEGDKGKKTEYHNVIVFGKNAENCKEYLFKGQQVLIEGSMTTRTWEKSDGTKGYKTETIATGIQFGSRQTPKIDQGEGEKDGVGQSTTKPRKADPVAIKPNGELVEYPEEEINPDDIPF